MSSLLSNSRLALVSSVAALAVTAGLGAPTMAQTIGKAGAVNPAASSTPPGGANRTIQVGGNIVFKERVLTTNSGSVQLVFVDKSTLNIGPNSQVTIDEFVYDPNRQVGRMAMTLTKGALRFVGGQTSHTGGATVTTPSTTIGIRGGVATVRHDNEGTRAINHFGTITVGTGPSAEVIRRPGFAVTVANTQAPPTAPRRVTQAEVDTNNRQLTSAGRQTGGAIQQPTDTGASRAGVGAVNAPVAPTQTSVQGQTTTEAATPPNQQQQQAAQQQSVVSQVTQQGSQTQVGNPTNTSGGTTTPPPPPLPPAPTPAAARAYALTMSSDPSLNTVGVPYLPANFIASGTMVTSPVYGYGVGGLNNSGQPNRTSRMIQVGLLVNGNGPTQVSTAFVMAGSTFLTTTPVTPAFSSGMTATSRSNSLHLPGRANSSVAGTPGTMTVDGTGVIVPASVTVTQNDIDSTTGVQIPEVGFSRPSGTSATTNYTFTQTAVLAATPPGLGTNRASTPTAYNGYSAGMMSTFNITTNTMVEKSVDTTGGVVFVLNGADARFGAQTIAARSIGSAPTGGFDNAVLQYGFQGSTTQNGRGAYIDDHNFAARETRLANNGPFPSTVNGTAVNFHRGYFFNSGTVDYTQIDPYVSWCACDYTKWGLWSSETNRTVGTTNYADFLHLGSWVAGRHIAGSEVPTVGTATYMGHAIASVRNYSAEYVAAGNFTNTVDFANRTGNVTISNLDGRNYTGTVNYGPGDTAFGGSISAISGPVTTGPIVGNFYRGPTSPVGEMGGVFSATAGPTYGVSGTFAAKKY